MKKKFGADRIYLIFTEIIIQIVLLLPWIPLESGRYNIYTYLFRLYHAENAMSLMKADFGNVENFMIDTQSMMFVFLAHLIMLVLVQFFGFINILFAFRKEKRAFFSVVCLVICSANLFSMPSGPVFFLDGWIPKLYLLVILILRGVNLVGFRMIDSWAEATEEVRRIKRHEREVKKERKERLAFEGKYSKLFYKVIEKNFKSSWETYRIFVLVGGMSISFIFAGIGMREMLSGAHGADNFARGQGLGTIVMNFLVAEILISAFLIVSVLMFYLKNHMKNYALFINLGMRSQTLYLFIGVEILSCIILSIVGGCLFGNLLSFLARKLIEKGVGQAVVLNGISVKTYLFTLLISVLLVLVSAMATHDIYIDTGASSSRYKDVLKEKMPGKFSPVFLALGLGIIFLSVSAFSEREKAEGIVWIGFFFFGLYLFLKHSINIYLGMIKKKKQVYFGSLLKKNYFYHHFKTAYRYLFLITILHICVLFVFGREVLSSAIAEPPESMYPYDYVCMATEKDQSIFEDIKEQCSAEIDTYPMVRVTNVDSTSALENIMAAIMPQGQHIGISESTYKKLCEKVGHPPKHFELDSEGQKVFLVFQEDESAKAHPIDYFLLDRTKPYLHIGQPLLYYDYLKREKLYEPREVAGMEIACLVGNLRQGEHENLVVFSDEYFEKVKDLWKTTNLNNGENVSDADAIEGVTIHHWPDRLVLMNVEDDKKAEVEKHLEIFSENHTFDDQFDSVVKSWYLKDDVLMQRKTERFMNLAVSLFVIGIMTIVTLVLLYMKAESEMGEKKRQQEFLKCMGMRKKERLRVIRSEMQAFFWLPMVTATLTTAIYTAIIWKIRMYTQADIVAYGKGLAVLYVVYVAIQFLGIKGLERYIIKKVEGSHGRNH